jgi:methionyl-tRNA synthetase
MSKSKLTGIAPTEITDVFGSDAYRFYFLSAIAFGQDGSFSWEDLAARYQSELANGFGNLASRTIAMIARYRDGATPDAEVDAALAADFEGLDAEVAGLLDRAEITQALERIWQRVRRLNRYVEEQAPWKLAKDPEQADRLDTVLRSLAEGLRVVTVLLHPYMPETTERLMGALGQDGGFAIEAAGFGEGGAGTVTTLDPPLFPKQP